MGAMIILQSMLATPRTSAFLDYIKLHYTYDPDTGIVCRDGMPNGVRHKKQNYIRCEPYIDGIQHRFSAHQVGWYLTYGEWPHLIDHIDHDGSNNKLSNLRLATVAQNGHNRKKCKIKTTSKYKGVSKFRSGWRASLCYQGKFLLIGQYTTEWDAAVAYNTKALELFGEFALLNLK
jgi:HNH endonuclease